MIQRSARSSLVNYAAVVRSMIEGPGSVEMTGAVVSVTLMVWLAVLELPHGSVAVQVRVTEYFCGQLPGVVTSAKVTAGGPPPTSVAVGVAKEGVAGHSMVVG